MTNMAHFAKLDENNVVTDVLVVSGNDLMVNGVEQEAKGIEFLTKLTGHANWKQTSYTGGLRKNYAVIGGIYDPQRDAFIAPKTLDSWVLNENTCVWEYCVPHPRDGRDYAWSEIERTWRELPPPKGATPVVVL